MYDTQISSPQLHEVYKEPAETVQQALEGMLETGASYVEDIISPEQRQVILDDLKKPERQAHGARSPFDFEPVQGRTVYYEGGKHTYSPFPDIFWETRDLISDSFDEFAKKHSEFSDWSMRAGTDRKATQQLRSLVEYPTGMDVPKHVDTEDGEYPSQVIITIEGGGEFLVYSDVESENPILRIPLKVGTAVFLRGNEVPGLLQLPHEVVHKGNGRVMACFGAEAKTKEISVNLGDEDFTSARDNKVSRLSKLVSRWHFKR